MSKYSRRDVMIFSGVAGASFAASECPAMAAGAEMEVTANEDLMREHGILRRALLVYRDAASRARHDPARIPLPALHKTAQLFRAFGEEYHERSLEEAHIFPVVRKLSGPVHTLPDVLQTQHARGRELTEYILNISSRARFPANDAASFAAAMDALDLMYEHHAAREDTLIFPAWKQALGAKGYEEMGDKFEDIERKTFGHDGFGDALKQIAAIEAEFGLSDLTTLTAPSPPHL
jgi:hemerythrin-like domain-containing protein